MKNRTTISSKALPTVLSAGIRMSLLFLLCTFFSLAGIAQKPYTQHDDAPAYSKLLQAQQAVIADIKIALGAPGADRLFFQQFGGGSAVPSQAWQARWARLQQAPEAALQLPVALLSNDVIEGAYAAFTRSGVDGMPAIFINSDWLQRDGSAKGLVRIMAEETGHALDAYLNGNNETPGDEGEAFALWLLHQNTTASEEARIAKENDYNSLMIEGQPVVVEEAAVYFNEIFQGTGTNYATNTNSVNNLIQINGSGFKFTSTDPNVSMFSYDANGNDISGTLSYVNTSGAVVSVSGILSRQNKASGTTRAFYFVNPAAHTGFLFVIPGFESVFSPGNNINTSGDPNFLNDLNNTLTTQQSAPKIAVNNPVVTEAAGYAVFQVTVSPAASSNYSFTPSLTANTATAGSDYTNSMQYSTDGNTWTNVTGTHSFAASVTLVYIRVAITDDAAVETTETFSLNTGTVSGGNILNNGGTYGQAQITDNDSPPPSGLSYNSPNTFTQGSAITPLQPTVTGNVTSWSISSSLPSGLSFSATTGVISGTPSTSAPAATYTVTASNNAGSTTASVTIQVDGPPHSLSYPSPAYLVSGQSVIPLIPSVTAHPPVTGYTYSGQLPAGLSFDPQTGVISGVPTASGDQQQLVITATNGAGSTSFTLTIVISQPPVITYPNLTLTANQAMTPASPTNTGGSIPANQQVVVASTEYNGFAAAQTYWQGLAIDPSGNAWIGTGIDNDVVQVDANGNTNMWTGAAMPAAGQPVFTPSGKLYVINTQGNIRVWDLDIANSGPATTITTNMHSSIGEKRFVPFEHAYYAIDDNQALVKRRYDATSLATAAISVAPYTQPKGLGMDYQNHVLYVGGPGYIKAYDTLLNLLATWGQGSANRSFVDGSASAARIGNATEVVVLGNRVIFWDSDYKRIRAIDISTGAISTIAGDGTASVTDGSGSAIQLSNVNGMTTYNSDLYVLDDGYIRKITLQQAYVISPALPAGLSIDPQSGTITGTPTVTQAATTYTATATNNAGSGATTFTITIGSAPSGLSYTSPMMLREGQAIAPGTYTATVANNPDLYSIYPALPSGVVFDTLSGEITGTPALGTAMPPASYRIKAFNDFGVDSVDVMIAVEGPVRNLSYGGNLVFANGAAITPVTPTYIAQPAVTSPGFQANIALPAGLILDGQTGTISGTPTGGASSGTYTISASNGFSPAATVTFTITITQPPVVQYATPQNYTVGQAIATLSPMVIGSPTIGFAISPALPSGLTFNASNGDITGTPTVATNPTTYTVVATNAYGSTPFQLVISTGTPPTGLSYQPGVHSYQVGAVINPDLLPTAALGTGSISYSISPNLPTGMSFNVANGAIGGTPTVPTTTATYTVTAVSVYGSASTTVQLQTGYAPSALSYNTPNVFNENVAIAPLTPTVTDTVGIYTISPALPAGLSLNPSTGVISGTPTLPQLSANYVVTAANVFGSTSFTVAIAVYGVPTNLSYGSTTLRLPSGITINPLVPTVSAYPAVTSWSISPAAMPPGLSFNSSTGTISGTPSSTSFTGTYQVTATNSAGTSQPLTITIIVTQAPVGLMYTSPNDLVIGSAITPLSPTVDGATPMTFTVQPQLPPGLSIDASTGIISGTPTVATPAALYLAKAENQYGFDTVSIWISTGVAPSGLSYPAGLHSYQVGAAVSLPPTTTPSGSGTITYTVSPSLPSGLIIDPATGVISGTPAAATGVTAYTITATSAYGSTTATVQVQTGYAPSALSYTTPNQFFRNTTITPRNPTVTGTVTSYSVSPALPTGLTINATSGVISGRPTGQPMLPTLYTVTASNAFGSTSFSLSIEIQGAPVNLSYPQSVYSLPLGVAVSNMVPTVIANPAASFSISQPLPAGLSFNTGTGAITGTPTVPSAPVTYTVTATNSYGSASVQITIEVTAPPSNLSYASPVNLPVGAPAAGVVPSVNGAVTSWSISGGTLPQGLTFNSITGEITGTPTIAIAAQQFTVTATNQHGSTTATLILATGNAPSGLSYNNSTQNLPVGTAINPMVPTANTGTGPVAYTVSPALPPGLTFDPNTGVIGGTPTTPTATATYTVTVTNPFGSVSTTVTLQTGRAPSGLSYQTPAVVMVNTTIIPLQPTVTDTVGSYSITLALPAGLMLNTATGVISGTPTVASLPADYTVTATNVFGSTTTIVNIEVQGTPVNLQYNIGSELYLGVAAGPFAPTVSASPAPAYSISPALPTGLLLDPTTGVISGTPTALSGPVTYTVTATNTFGSASTNFTFSVVLAPPSNLAYSPAQVNAIAGTAIATMMPSVQGGAVATWSISPALPAGLSFDPQTGIISGTLVTQQSGVQTYTVTASNSGGSTMAQVVISYNVPSVITGFSLPQSVVYGVMPINITAPQSNNSAPFTYSTSDSAVAVVTGNVITITGVGSVTITASQPASGNYLAGSDSATILVTPAPLTITANNSLRCINTANGTLGYTATGFVAGEDSSVLLVQPTVTTTATANSPAGTYTTMASGAQAANYSITYQTGTLTVSTPQYNAQRLPAVDAIVGEATQLQARTFGTTYQWSPATGLSSTTQAMPSTTLQQEQQYTIAMMESTGCVVIDTLKVRVFERPDVFIPSLFSPNGDGVNDMLRINPVGIKQLYYFRVFNKWGTMLFMTANPNEGWDGRYRGTLQQMDTYTWILSGVDKNGKLINRSGTVTLVR